MSHSYQGTEGTIFQFNSDFSGSITISYDGNQVEVPAKDLLEFVAYSYIAPKKIEFYEEASPDQILLR